MLRYIELAGLIEPARNAAGYRLFGPGELQRLRTLRELLGRFGCNLAEMAFAKRMAREPELRTELEHWFAEQARRPDDVSSDDWLRFEQEKHERLLAAAG